MFSSFYYNILFIFFKLISFAFTLYDQSCAFKYNFAKHILTNFSFESFHANFILQPNDLIRWKQVAARFSELITEAATQLRRNEEQRGIRMETMLNSATDYANVRNSYWRRAVKSQLQIFRLVSTLLRIALRGCLNFKIIFDELKGKRTPPIFIYHVLIFRQRRLH